MNLNNAGIYIHIPFCRSKCPYCDFYSLRLDEDSADAYTDALLRRIPALASRYGVSADTIYLGGGTPSALGAERIARIVGAAREFAENGAEITVECNPFDAAKRVSISPCSRRRASTGYPWECSRQTTANAAPWADSAAGTMSLSPSGAPGTRE